ncbi:MerR family transcriptional regulator [Streptomyces sp. NPDC048629]|uniref:MerR family transcriptional regulator n=1 Tax=Streptomyces sp. NPDC048629 TaxID=3154824 RepID=UPI00344248EC
MNGDTYLPIGELARRAGVTVKTVRHWSDLGIVPPADRSPAGYRRYRTADLARLALVRTLRELGLDLPTIREVVDRRATLPEVAAAHAAALEAQIRTLRTRRAVLTAVARRGSTLEETDLMHRLATLTADERHRHIADFLDSAFPSADSVPELAAARRSMTPDLPDDPDDEQIEAWLELAELAEDPEFRAVLRALVDDQAADRAATSGGSTAERSDGSTAGLPRPGLVHAVRACAGPAHAAGIDPASPEAEPVLARIAASSGLPAPVDLLGLPDLLGRLERAADPRRERYLRLLAVVNGWAAPDSPVPALHWTVAALRARAAV